MKRFYKQAAAEPAAGVFIVTLDGRPVRTPGRRPLRLPSRPLGEAVAAEWHGQGDEIDPATMPLTRLANSAADRTAPNRAQVIGRVASYAETDLLCYRAEAPAELVARQAEEWQPLLDWLEEAYGARLAATAGIVPMAQDRCSLLAVYATVAGFDDFRLTGLHAVTAASGSVTLALALAAGRIDAERTWCAAHLDELYQADRWGGDAEAENRRAALRDEIAAAARFMALAHGDG